MSIYICKRQRATGIGSCAFGSHVLLYGSKVAKLVLNAGMLELPCIVTKCPTCPTCAKEL